jgi:hypothetical protein
MGLLDGDSGLTLDRLRVRVGIRTLTSLPVRLVILVTRSTKVRPPATNRERMDGLADKRDPLTTLAFLTARDTIFVHLGTLHKRPEPTPSHLEG